MTVVRLIAVVATLTLCAPVLAASPPEPAPVAADPFRVQVPDDPAIRRGVLPNGLRYAVMHAGAATGPISLRLGLDVGSYDESDTQRGFAHFVEHSAFRSTRDFPDNAVDRTFAAKGVTFGRDINAGTALRSTRFQLDLPAANDVDVELALKWLRDVADGIVFDTAGLDKERGVILAEKEARNSPQTLADAEIDAFQSPELRSASRDPIGTEASLRAATPQMLEAFYNGFYRPDRAIVVMVGGLSLDAMEAKVRTSFESWRAAGPAPAARLGGSPIPPRGLDTASFDHAALLRTIRACRLTPSIPRGRQDIHRVRRDALGDIWREILEQRLSDLRNASANSLLGARMVTEDNGLDERATCLVVLPVGDEWRPALAAAQRELRRFQDAGPTDLELEKAVDSVRSHLRGAITAAPNRTSADLAEAILDLALDGEVLAEPRQTLRVYDVAVEDLSVTDVRAAFADDWRGSGPLISVVSPSPPRPDAVRAAWLAVDGGGALTEYADHKDTTWAYDFGPAGAIASRQPDPTGNYVRIVFRNGVRLNFKQTAFDANSVQLDMRFGAGRRALAPGLYQTAVIGGALASFGGDGKYTFDDLRRMFEGDAAMFRIAADEDAFRIGGTVSRPNLADQLRVLAAFMTDPGFRPSVDPLLREAIAVAHRAVRTDPANAADNALVEAVAPGSPLAFTDPSNLDGLTSARVAEILRPEILHDPIEITLVGDIEERSATALVGESLGALPARTAPPPPGAAVPYLSFPPVAPPVIRTTHAGPGDKAATKVVWPLYPGTRARLRETAAITLMAAIFSDELRRRVRVELGKSYAPTVVAMIDESPDQGYLAATVESRPADLGAMLDEIRAVARRLKEGDINADQMAAARAPILARDRQTLTTNARWANGIARASRGDAPLGDMLDHGKMVASLTLEDVRKVAADWLSQEPLVAVSTPATPSPDAKP